MLTALQFVAAFQQWAIRSVGHHRHIWWMIIDVDADGTEWQRYLIMELHIAGSPVTVRFIRNPSDTDLIKLDQNPSALWDHPRHEILTKEFLKNV